MASKRNVYLEVESLLTWFKSEANVFYICDLYICMSCVCWRSGSIAECPEEEMDNRWFQVMTPKDSNESNRFCRMRISFPAMRTDLPQQREAGGANICTTPPPQLNDTFVSRVHRQTERQILVQSDCPHQLRSRKHLHLPPRPPPPPLLTLLKHTTPGRHLHWDQTREMTNTPPPLPPTLTHSTHPPPPHDSNLHGRCPTETNAALTSNQPDLLLFAACVSPPL